MKSCLEQELNALVASICNRQIGSGLSGSSAPRMVWASFSSFSVPAGTPTANWVGPSDSAQGPLYRPQRVLPTCRLQVLLMATGRAPPPGFSNPTSLEIASPSRVAGRSWPVARSWAKRAMGKESPPAGGRSILRCSYLKPKTPGAPPRGKARACSAKAASVKLATPTAPTGVGDGGPAAGGPGDGRGNRAALEGDREGPRKAAAGLLPAGRPLAARARGEGHRAD
mmetsp:Transcript_44320/g.64828  ORF Transcript_44320/g.64828 Transcript_44320/m.64828 type:complete len:226 (+) Transcript_44320:146-823(+)